MTLGWSPATTHEVEINQTSGAVTLTNARVVLSDRVLAPGSVTVERGLITNVTVGVAPAGHAIIDLEGRYLMPGLVDLHNDALELEVNPRPTANFPIPGAVLQIDRKLAMAGVTTQFHAISFMERARATRSLGFATDLARGILAFRDRPECSIDHYPLLRLDVRTPGALDALLGVLPDAPIPLVSLNDHVPGRGQYKDLDAYRVFVGRGVVGIVGQARDEQIEEIVTRELRYAEVTQPLVDDTVARLMATRDTQPFTIVSHDDDSPEDIEQSHALGSRIAEFPLTIAAAARAQSLGMITVVGAPNLLRGGSLSGNVSAADLIREGLADVLVADYYAPALLMGVFKTVDDGLDDLSGAVRRVTANPAAAVGLLDRGVIDAGRRADLIVVERTDYGPTVSGTMVAGRWRYYIPPDR